MFFFDSIASPAVRRNELNESGELTYDDISLDRISKVGLSCAGYLVGRRDSHMPLDRQLGTISLDMPNTY